MIAKIEIECDNRDQLLTHIYVIADQIHTSKKFSKDTGEVSTKTVLTDSNCYGTHEVTITP